MLAAVLGTGFIAGLVGCSNPTAAPDAPTDTSDASAPDETANAGCAQGEQPETYTVQSGDTPGRVAVANDVTVAELAAANQGVTGYAGFVVGIEITVPC